LLRKAFSDLGAASLDAAHCGRETQRGYEIAFVLRATAQRIIGGFFESKGLVEM
jgi:hypothetical protein